MSDNQLLYKLAFNFIPNIGAVHAKNLISYCGGIEKVFSASKRQLLSTPGIGEKRVADIQNSNALEKAEQELKAIDGEQINLLFYLDDNYPEKLKRYQDSPILLYSKGNVNMNAHRTIAIVGTRKVTPYGIIQCERIIEELQQYDCTIISGLAYGVDTYAHRKSVELKIPTIGVLGHGMNTIYPADNRKLAKRMMDQGGIVSEYPMDTKPDAPNFPRRNRIIAGVADVIIVVESAIKGGSMITAEYANNYNKDVFAIPGRTNDEFSAGCNHLIKTHKAHLLQSADDISYIMRWDKPEQGKQMQLIVDLDPEEQTIIDIIRKTLT